MYIFWSFPHVVDNDFNDFDICTAVRFYLIDKEIKTKRLCEWLKNYQSELDGKKAAIYDGKN